MKLSPDQQRQETATQWYVRLQNPQLPASERIEFRRWLDSEPANTAAFQAVENLWRRLGEPARKLAGDGWHRRKLGKTWLRGPLLTCACTIALALCALLWRDPGLLQRYNADLASAPGNQRQLTLEDGSQVLLDGDSALSLFFNANERRVRLLRGRAWFDVPHDAKRPFVVDSLALQTRAHGTAFAVDASGPGEQITVSRGSVEVRTADGDALYLATNQQATLQAGDLRGPLAVDADQALAWRRGQLIFERARLAEVVERLQHMGHPPVLLLDQRLREQRFSGTFPNHNPQALLAVLSSELGLNSTRIPGLAVLLHR